MILFLLRHTNTSDIYDLLLKSLLTGTSKAWVGLNDGTPYEVTLGSASIPSGVICIWSGNQNNIPTGWALCDGNNGTPNLSNRFVLGYGSKSCGSSGGSETVSLSTSNMPSHSHSASSTLSVGNAGSHSHTVTVDSSSGGSTGRACTLNAHTHSITVLKSASSSSKSYTTSNTGSHNHTLSGSISIGSSGSGRAHNNMPVIL